MGCPAAITIISMDFLLLARYLLKKTEQMNFEDMVRSYCQEIQISGDQYMMDTARYSIQLRSAKQNLDDVWIEQIYK